MRKSLILLLLFFSAMTSYAYDVFIDGIYYNLVPKAKQATVAKCIYANNINYAYNIVIPEKITSDGVEYSVTSIGGSAFSSCYALTSIDIPNTVTSIGDYAFSGCPLTSIDIPNSVTLIGNYAFKACSLTSIFIPNSVTSIGDYAFSYCPLTSIYISNSVTEIGNYAFAYCSDLIEITIGASVKTIGSEAFANCWKLAGVYCYAVTPPSTTSFFGSEDIWLYVPAKSLSKYRSTSPWSDYVNINAMPFPTDDYALVDGEEYTNMFEEPYDYLTYTRHFTNTNWNALYVPFAMQYNDWNSDFEVARLNDVHQFDDNEDGEIDRTVLELIKLKDGSSIEPNTPYLIKAKEIGEKTITLTDATLYAAEENSFDVTSWFTKFTFTGTYSTVTDMATKGHYAMVDGGLKQATSDAATLGAFRWYLDVTDRNGNPTPLAGKKVLLSFDDGEVTEVANVSASSCSKVSEIHTVSGMKIAKDKALQQKGVYIIDGNKILVR